MRTVLYANKGLSEYLAANFVLAWTSERPVPKITIDFGDGRKLERTITGNAVHYVTDAQGHPLDALPGLYAPGHFKNALEKARLLHAEVKDKPEAQREALVKLFHASRAASLELAFGTAVNRAGGQIKPSGLVMGRELTDAEAEFMAKVDENFARKALVRAASKSRVEGPMLNVIMGYDRAGLEATTVEVWRKIAFAELPNPGLDSRSLVLMAREVGGLGRLDAAAAASVRNRANPFAAEKAVERAMGKSVMVEGPMLKALSEAESALAKMAGNFEETLAMDTLRNEYQFHSQVHHWFAKGEVKDFDGLNERVYREVFLTPRSDKWLGLADEGSFTGIDG